MRRTLPLCYLLAAIIAVASVASITSHTVFADTKLGGNPATASSSLLGGNPNPSSQTSSGGGVLQNPLKNIDSLPELLTAVLKAVVRLGVIVLTLALIWVGFLFVAAQGAPEKIQSARSALIWTVIGGLILLGAEAIGLVIESTVNTLGT